MDIWKETFPSIGLVELHRLISRLKRHAKIISHNVEGGKISLIVGYTSIRDRISTRVLLSSWIGKRNYESTHLPGYKLKRSNRNI